MVAACCDHRAAELKGPGRISRWHGQWERGMVPAEGSRGEAETSGVRDLLTQARSKALVKPLGNVMIHVRWLLTATLIKSIKSLCPFY